VAGRPLGAGLTVRRGRPSETYDERVTDDRDALRARIAADGLTADAVEQVARVAFARLPITVVDRARAELARFFSGAPWGATDDAGLAALVGPGVGRHTMTVGGGTVGFAAVVAFGWKDGAFTIGFDVPGAVTLPVHPRTLGDTFEGTLVIEMTNNPTELRFVTGPGSIRGVARHSRDKRGDDPAVASLFDEFPDIEMIRTGAGTLTVTLNDFGRWGTILLQFSDTVGERFVQLHEPPPDRNAERAVRELGGLDPANPRELARLLDATTAPDAVSRRVALAQLEGADLLAATKPWTRALGDSSRAVRRAAIRAACYSAAPELRSLFERALGDTDACVRYYAVRALHEIGSSLSRELLEPRLRDTDLRVRIATQATLEARDVP